MPEVIFAAVHPELKKLIDEDVEAQHTTLNQYIANVLSQHLGRPDLSWIPRKKRGGRRKPKLPAEASA